MHIFHKYINPRIILSSLLGIAILGLILVIFTINRINKVLSTDIGFNKDSIITLKTKDVTVALPESMVYASNLPGVHINNSIDIKAKNREIKFAHQYISDTYFSFFKYEKLIESPDIITNNRNLQIYINETALKKLGIKNAENAIGLRLLGSGNRELIICGVVKDYSNLCIRSKKQAIIFQVRNEKLAYAFYNEKEQSLRKNEQYLNLNFISFQERLQNRFRFIGDLLYSMFLIINAIILITGIAYIGNKYAFRREKELFKILGIGVHIITLIVSKTYVYIIIIIGLVAGPISYVIQKFWLEIYKNRIQFGLVDLFIIFSVLFLTVYLVCCPKKNINEQLKKRFIQN